MSTSLQVKLASAVLAAGLALPMGIGLAAEQPSADQIINALKPPRLTRSLTMSRADTTRSAEEARFVDGLRGRTTRSLSTDEREKLVSLAKTKPSVDLEINFEFNSAIIGARALPQVTALGEALTSAELKGATFVVAGHTDAKGGETYNLGLSERRAEAVKQYLQEKYGIEATNLVPAGYGKTQLKNTSNPFAGENRRVQIVNMVK